MKRPALIAPSGVRPMGPARRPLPFMTAQVRNPLANPKAKTLEDAGKEIMAKLTEAYRAQERQQKATFAARDNAHYYRVVVFLDSEQAEAWTKALGIKPETLYLDGRDVAAKTGIALPAPGAIGPKKVQTDRKLAALARKVD